MLGWIRPLRRRFWKMVPQWKRAHKFMSNQALGLGTAALTVFIAIEASKELLLGTLAVTAASVLYGTLVEQPELDDG